jgi:hypothetical protein
MTNDIILTYIEKAVCLVDTEINFIERQILLQYKPDNVSQSGSQMIQWEGSVMEFTELVYALHESGSFGKTPIKALFSVFGKVFGCEVKNQYRLFWSVKNRTGYERTFFLDKLRNALSDKLERMDSGARS